jgi:hypothetical protein
MRSAQVRHAPAAPLVELDGVTAQAGSTTRTSTQMVGRARELTTLQADRQAAWQG